MSEILTFTILFKKESNSKVYSPFSKNVNSDLYKDTIQATSEMEARKNMEQRHNQFGYSIKILGISKIGGTTNGRNNQ